MRKGIIFSAMILMTFVGQAQVARLGVYFNKTMATGEFGNNLGKNPNGIILNGMYGLKNTGFSVGGEFGVSMYSNRAYTLETATETVKIHEEDCYYTGKVIVRYNFLKNTAISPFIVGKVGFSTFFSDMVAEEETEAFENRFESHGTAFNSGVGAGLGFNISKLFNFGSQNYPIYFDCSANRNYGSVSNYRDIKSDDGATKSLNNGHFKSKTSHMDFHFGLNFTI